MADPDPTEILRQLQEILAEAETVKQRILAELPVLDQTLSQFETEAELLAALMQDSNSSVEQAKQAYDVFVPAAPLDLAGIQFNWRMGTSVLAGWLGAMLVGLVLPSEWRMAVHAGASGGLIGIAAGLTGHFIFARRRHLARFEPEG